jgi:hypothetical protein
VWCSGPAGLLAVAFVVSVGCQPVPAPAPAPEADPVPEESVELRHWVEPIPDVEGAVAVAAVGPGYQTFPGIVANRGSYAIRLVASGFGDVEALRPHAQQVANELTSITGHPVTVGVGQIGSRVTQPGEILVFVTGSSPCDQLGPWDGCGGPTEYASVHGGVQTNAGNVWVKPRVLGMSSGARQYVMAHELGHALGLDHFNSTFEGRRQVMNGGGVAVVTYQTGDQNGFRALAPANPAVPPSDPAPSVDLCPTAVGGLHGCPSRMFWDRRTDGRIDLDGDRKSDVVRSDGTDFFVSSGGASGWRLLNRFLLPIDAVAFADMNGDGRSDVVRSDPADGYFYVSWGGSTGWVRLNHFATSLDNVRFADMNGDRKADVVHSDGVNFYVSSGGTTGWTVLNQFLTTLDRVQFADVNGDRKADVVHSDGVNFYVSSGGTSGWTVLNQFLTGLDTVAFADLTGDGKADVVHSDGVHFYVSAGGASSWASLNQFLVPLDQVALR